MPWVVIGMPGARPADAPPRMAPAVSRLVSGRVRKQPLVGRPTIRLPLQPDCNMWNYTWPPGASGGSAGGQNTVANPPPGVRKFVVWPWYRRAASISTRPS